MIEQKLACGFPRQLAGEFKALDYTVADDFSRGLLIRLHALAQTLYSIIRRDNMKIDFELLLRICDALHVPLETFCGTGSTDPPTPEEWETLWKLRRLDAHGRLVTLQLLDAECARMQSSEQQPEQQKIIPLYMTPAAAGYASPALGDDYEDYAVGAD